VFSTDRVMMRHAGIDSWPRADTWLYNNHYSLLHL